MAFTHILVPTDFSETANRAVRSALEEATVHHAQVTLLHILPAHTSTDVYFVTGAPQHLSGVDQALTGRLGPATPSPSSVVRHDHTEEALSHLRDLVPPAFEGAWDVDVAAGPPAETIVRVAQSRGVDLIVMGTHGRTGLRHVFMGSVAEKVVRLASCPVLTVHGDGSMSRHTSGNA